MKKHALKALWWLIIVADAIGITLIINPQLVPAVAAMLTIFSIRWLTVPLIPEPAYDWPRWAYRIGFAVGALPQRHRTRRANRATARAAEPTAPRSASGTAARPARPRATAPHPN